MKKEIFFFSFFEDQEFVIKNVFVLMFFLCIINVEKEDKKVVRGVIFQFKNGMNEYGKEIKLVKDELSVIKNIKLMKEY